MAKLDINIPNTKLPDGHEIPLLGYGTGTAWTQPRASSASSIIESTKTLLGLGYSEADAELIEATKTAIKLGYHHLDGAEIYGNETALGQAIKDSGVPRESLFVTTKFWSIKKDVIEGMDISLKKLGLTYVDLYLLHHPWDAEGDKTVIQRAWAQMEQLLASGKARSIGVSNFYREHLDALLETAKVRPAINQIEYHPYLQHGDLIAFHKNNDIRVAAYGPLAPYVKAKDGPLTPLLEELAKKYAVSPGEILLRWVIDQNIVAVTTSSKEQRMSDMLRVATFTLTPKEQESISETGNKHHFRQFWGDKFDKDDRS